MMNKFSPLSISPDACERIELRVPAPFSWSECLAYLGRSDLEIMHRVEEDCVYKAVELNGYPILLKLDYTQENVLRNNAMPASVLSALRIGFPQEDPGPELRNAAEDYVRDWFGLDDDLEAFSVMAQRDPILGLVVSAHAGLRLIGIPDLFEALTWAIIGQQISLPFAYTMKRRLVEAYGETLSISAAADAVDIVDNTTDITVDAADIVGEAAVIAGDDVGIMGAANEPFHLFPRPARIAALTPDDLRPMQFSGRKAEYIIGIAQMMEEGRLSKEGLLRMDEEQAREMLLSIRGVGAWTADYVGMKCLRRPSAFPIADAGLHQALKRALGLNRKPHPNEIAEVSAGWHGWEAYATFYLWQSLL
ncbi:DNA-3-methyladenine glycosylase 2 [Saccharibacillus kuerlensis]|uniref:DNA-3-methyladenine glycosylase II n=1 Tax=Saccharibacillus kuerlensis TaxID=459527 RepID=A0ABQ2L815_9BACL|nr:DNA-3-methyladenine glycosylase 2 [Saccharibacillus kuerlensis]GGO05241.1 DNA-3-methyladenine glycosylase [Saccharibacillus kuerlensis]